MRRHAGIHRPAERWEMRSLFPGATDKQKTPAFADLIKPWVGSAHELASEADRELCRVWLSEHAPNVELPPGLRALLEPGRPAAIADLRTVLDVALIRQHTPVRRPLRILEVGGGYGRLVEGLLDDAEASLQYALVDAVPATLYYAYEYLRRRFPERAIGSTYTHANADPTDFDCFVIPTWRLEDPPSQEYDVAINIASFQEMESEHVEHYIGVFDRAVRIGGTLYVCNSRVFTTRRVYEYPKRWKTLVKCDVPLSFMPYKPAEVLRRTNEDWTGHNAKIDRAYLESLYHAEHSRAEALKAENRDLRAAGRRQADLPEVERMRDKTERCDAGPAEGKVPGEKARQAEAQAQYVQELRSGASPDTGVGSSSG